MALAEDGSVDEAETRRLRGRRLKDNRHAAFNFGPEREAWEGVFDDGVMGELNRRLLELPKAVRQDRRRWIIEQAVPELPLAGAGSLVDAIVDADATRARLRQAMAAVFDGTG